MAAGFWVLPPTARTNLLNGAFDLDSDSFKMALITSSTNITAASINAWSGVTGEVASSGVGYSSGGVSVALALSGTTAVKVDIAYDPIWTASGGSIVAKYAVIYEVGGNVLVYCLLDSGSANITIANTNVLTVAANTSGLFSIS